MRSLKKRRNPLYAVGLVLVALLIAWGINGLSKRSEANAEAQKVWESLKSFKTVKDMNTEKELAGIARRSDSVTAIAETGFALGVRALAKVWEQGWTYSARRRGWSEPLFDEGRRYAEEALAKKRTPEALLALGLLYSGACRKMPDEKASERNEHCEEASKVLDEAERRNGTDHERDWLEIEILWTAVMTEDALGNHLTDTFRDDAGARRVYQRASDRCQKAWPRLPGAPINSRELAQECLLVTGKAWRFGAYLEWSDWLIKYDFRDHGQLRLSAKTDVFRSVDHGCRDILVPSKGPPPKAQRPSPRRYHRPLPVPGLGGTGLPGMGRAIPGCQTARRAVGPGRRGGERSASHGLRRMIGHRPQNGADL